MKNDGFLLYDSILSLLVFGIVLMLIPAILHIQNIDSKSQQQLDFYRQLYIDSLNMDKEEFIDFAKNEYDKHSIKCNEKLSDLCP